MIDLTSSDLTLFVGVADGELVTDSRAVARAFQKRHKNVLQSIDAMRDSKVPEIAEHHRLNFQPMLFPVTLGHGAVRNVPGYRMTYDGLSELAMGFSGDKARILRIRFLAAFRDVNERLRNVSRSNWELMRELDRRDDASRALATVGAHILLARKRELPGLRTERVELEALLQPCLFALN